VERNAGQSVRYGKTLDSVCWLCGASAHMCYGDSTYICNACSISVDEVEEMCRGDLQCHDLSRRTAS
jgi:hypothetical protein